MNEIEKSLKEIETGYVIYTDHDVIDWPKLKTSYAAIPRLVAALREAHLFIRGKLVCLGDRHDCPSCNGTDAEDTLAELSRILRGEGEK